MNRKVIIGAIAVIILVIIGVRIKYKEESAPTEIIFGNECTADEECEESFKKCRNEIETSCENGCIYGRCTKCVPICPVESRCGNITCLDSVRICPDGKKARCANYCDTHTEKCTLCTPECNITIKDGINYQLKDGKFILDSVPCIDVNYTEKEKIRIIKKNISEIELPSGYSIIIEPFTVNEDGPLELTLNIPEIYTDVRALRCREKECNPVSVKYVTELRCGKRISKAFLREKAYLEPKFMPIKIKEKSLNLMSGQDIRSSKYKVRFEGNSEKLGVTLSMPKEPIEEAENPGLKITGTPLIIEVEGKVNDNVNAAVTMPYTSLEGFEENSVGIYIKVKNGWGYVGGEINKENKTVTSTITNVNNYLNEENKIKTALMGILCISCYGSTLTRVYQPEKGSKDAIILIHGFVPEPNTFQQIIDDIRLTNQPFEVWTFNYPTSNSIKESTNELMSLLEKNHANYENIHLVTHSLGGIIAQQALYTLDLENKKSLENKEPLAYNYLDKIKKVILVATSNEGSPVAGVYRNLFEHLINNKKETLFNLNSQVIKDIAEGVITPRVPGIDYRVIAGTRTYGFNLLFFKSTEEGVYEKNDGIVTVKSAQHIGDKYIDNQCEDYWEVNLTHTELIDDPLARKIIGNIISEDIPKKDTTAILGHNKYFDLSAEGLAGDTYVIIGKKTKKEMVADETGCSCGNGYCGEGENEINCPSDCARFLSKKNKKRLVAVLAAVLISSFIASKYISRKRLTHPHLKAMIHHIKTNYEIVPDKGYTHKQIRDAFLSKGWPKRIVDDSIRLLKKEFHHNYHEPLKKHLKEHLKKGYAKEDIKKALVDSGWEGKAVEKVLDGEKLEPSFKPKEEYKHRPVVKGKRIYFG